MRKIFTIIGFIFCCTNAKAQYVNIPDSNFRNYLKLSYPSCFNSAGQMDTTCNDIVSYSYGFNLSSMNIVNLEGIQYFKKLYSITVEHSPSIVIPKLPSTITQLQFDYDSNIVLNNLPDSLQFFSCNYCNLSSLPNLPNSLTRLYCNSNNLAVLPNLPNLLYWLECNSNALTKLPIIPISLSFLDCSKSNKHK